jgi:hypothetical protein
MVSIVPFTEDTQTKIDLAVRKNDHREAGLVVKGYGLTNELPI